MDGIQSSNYTQASAARTNASLKHTEANQFRLADLSEFENFIDASVSDDTELADFYRMRFRDEFEPAYEAWIALEPLTTQPPLRARWQCPSTGSPKSRRRAT